MKKDELFQLGKIVRTFGSKGEVVIQLETDTPSRYKNLESVFININENLVPFFIERIQLKLKNQAVVKFLDIDSPDDTSLILNRSLFLPIELLPKLKGKNTFYFHEVTGYQVIDCIKGDIGIVKSVLELPQQALLEIEFNNKEILIPIADEIIKKVDKKKRIVEIESPEGLIDIYLE